MNPSRIVVVSSCTGDKMVKGPGLTLADFVDDARRERREAELSKAQQPAEVMYTGWQHRYFMRGVSRLRQAFGIDFVDLRILSAGYGLIEANRKICPYDVTFNEMSRAEVRDWSRRLGVPDDIRQAVAAAPLAIFLLGSRYLDAVGPPIRGSNGQRLLFLAKPSEHKRLAARGVTVVPAGREQAALYGAGLVALKGKMFELFASSVEQTPSLLDDIQADPTPGAFQRALVRTE